MAIKILIDSASDINKEEATKLGIEMIPMIISFGEEEFEDGVTLLPHQFYEKLIESVDIPKTSQVNPFRFEEKFESLTKDGSEVIAITISSKLSNTFNSAKKAAEKFEGKVHIIDSMSACIGERLLCYYALQLIKENKLSTQEIVDELNTKKSKINVMAAINTLKYLKKGGRISALTAFAGEMLSIKPVVAIVKGEVKMIGKAMGSKKANNLLNQIVEQKGGIDFNMPFGAIWSGLDRTTLDKYIEDSSSLWKDYAKEVPSFILGGTIGTHIGPGAVGVAFFEK